MACGFLKSDCVSMQKQYCFTCSGCVLCILYLPFSFIQWLILTDSPLSVIWWQALFCLTSCWVALLCAKSVKIILWALYLQPTLKSYSHSALSSLRTAWVGKGLEQNTLKCEDACFHYTLRTTKTLWTYFELVDRDTTRACSKKFLLWFRLRLVLSRPKVLMTWLLHKTADLLATGCLWTQKMFCM